MKIKKGRVYVAATRFADASLGDLHYVIPIAKMSNEGWLCISTTGNAGFSDLNITTMNITKNKFKCRIINQHGTVSIFGEFPLTKNFIEVVLCHIKGLLHTGIENKIIETFILAGAGKNNAKKPIKISIEDIVEKGACRGGIEWWIRKYGRKEVFLKQVIKEAPTEYKIWLKKHFKEENIINFEDIKEFLIGLIEKKGGKNG